MKSMKNKKGINNNKNNNKEREKGTAQKERHRAKAHQGGRRSGAMKINSKHNYVKIYGPGTEKGITGFPWIE